MLLCDLSINQLPEAPHLHKPCEIDPAELFQLSDFVDNFVQFLLNPGFDPMIQRLLFWISLDLLLQLIDFGLELMTDIMLKRINLGSIQLPPVLQHTFSSSESSSSTNRLSNRSPHSSSDCPVYKILLSLL